MVSVYCLCVVVVNTLETRLQRQLLHLLELVETKTSTKNVYWGQPELSWYDNRP